MPRPPTDPAPEATPSPLARELVRGAVDLHVHVEPDLAARRIDDLGLARRSLEVGLGGFVLKSHYVPTAERAAVVRSAVPGVHALGAIALNAGVGGLNAQAVEIAARGDARVVWLPTVDSENEASEDGPKPAKQPVWRNIQDEFVAAGIAGEPVPVSAELLAPVLEVVARHQLVLATGHLGSAEIRMAVTAALAAGVGDVLVTHPDYPTQGVSVEDQVALAGQGAFLERCFAPIHSGKISWEATFEAIRATGVERNVLSTDLGQLTNPPVEDGLALMADALLGAGFTEERDPVDGRRQHEEACPCRVTGCSSSAPTPPTSSGVPPVRSRPSRQPVGRPRSWRSPTASVASRVSSGRKRADRGSGQGDPPCRGPGRSDGARCGVPRLRSRRLSARARRSGDRATDRPDP